MKRERHFLPIFKLGVNKTIGHGNEKIGHVKNNWKRQQNNIIRRIGKQQQNY